MGSMRTAMNAGGKKPKEKKPLCDECGVDATGQKALRFNKQLYRKINHRGTPEYCRCECKSNATMIFREFKEGVENNDLFCRDPRIVDTEKNSDVTDTQKRKCAMRHELCCEAQKVGDT